MENVAGMAIGGHSHAMREVFSEEPAEMNNLEGGRWASNPPIAISSSSLTVKSFRNEIGG